MAFQTWRWLFYQDTNLSHARKFTCAEVRKCGVVFTGFANKDKTENEKTKIQKLTSRNEKLKTQNSLKKMENTSNNKKLKHTVTPAVADRSEGSSIAQRRRKEQTKNENGSTNVFVFIMITPLVSISSMIIKIICRMHLQLYTGDAFDQQRHIRSN